MGWVSDGSTASGLSPPPVPSTRAPPRAGARRSGLTAPCAPPRAEAVRTVKDTQNSFSRAAAEINVLQSPPYFRADEDSFGRAPGDANWVSPRGGGSHFARRDPRGFDRERRRRAERQARPQRRPQGGGVSRNVCQISSWQTTSAWTARTSEPTGRSRESWCSKGSGYLPRPSTASPSSPLGWC